MSVDCVREYTRAKLCKQVHMTSYADYDSLEAIEKDSVRRQIDFELQPHFLAPFNFCDVFRHVKNQNIA